MKKIIRYVAAALVVGLAFVSCKTSVEQGSPDFVLVQGGTYDGTTALTPPSQVFIEGRSITIGDLYVCDHEVTQKEYETYCFYSNIHDAPREEYGKGENLPAYGVYWYDAIVYCNVRSIAEGLTPVYSINGESDPTKWGGIQTAVENEKTKYSGPDYDYVDEHDSWDSVVMNIENNGYRLPTEAEWEYVARGGNRDSYTYSGSNNLDEVAWYEDNSNEILHEVKTKAPNSLGIYDMSGNGTEWCWDRHANEITTTTPATGPVTGNSRVCRSGWDNEDCTVAHRSGTHTMDDLGFRLVRSKR